MDGRLVYTNYVYITSSSFRSHYFHELRIHDPLTSKSSSSQEKMLSSAREDLFKLPFSQTVRSYGCVALMQPATCIHMQQPRSLSLDPFCVTSLSISPKAWCFPRRYLDFVQLSQRTCHPLLKSPSLFSVLHLILFALQITLLSVTKSSDFVSF